MGFFIIYLIPACIIYFRVGSYEENIFESLIICNLKFDVYIGKPKPFRKIAACNSSSENIGFSGLGKACRSIGDFFGDGAIYRLKNSRIKKELYSHARLYLCNLRLKIIGVYFRASHPCTVWIHQVENKNLITGFEHVAAGASRRDC